MKYRKTLAATVLLMVGLVAAAARASVEVRVSGPASGTPVVLLHGLFRTGSSMSSMANALSESGYRVCNITYPSRNHPVEVLARRFVAPGIRHCFPDRSLPLNLVTYSMGGILARQLLSTGQLGAIGRVVMLAPPNSGTEVVEALGAWSLFGAVVGPAGLQMGTDPDDVPRQLGPANYEVGVVAGNSSINPVFSRYLPGADDGTVSVASTRLEGMRDFLILPASHSFMIRNREAIRQTILFLDHGLFSHENGSAP